jgi:hypothetical protein
MFPLLTDFKFKAKTKDMKMQSHKYSKSFYHLLLGIISVTTLPRASSIPTTLSPITTASVNKASSSQVNSFDNTGKGRN